MVVSVVSLVEVVGGKGSEVVSIEERTGGISGGGGEMFVCQTPLSVRKFFERMEEEAFPIASMRDDMNEIFDTFIDRGSLDEGVPDVFIGFGDGAHIKFRFTSSLDLQGI